MFLALANFSSSSSSLNDDKREKKKIPISRGDHQQPEKES